MTNKPSQPGGLEDQLAELEDLVSEEKVELTEEVSAYLRDEVEVVQKKLLAGEDVLESDLAFIGEVKMWVRLPEEWREKLGSVEEMLEDEEVMEAIKREISLQQWLDVLHVAEAACEGRDWIDQKFKFEGGGKIMAKGGLYLSRGHKVLTRLPEGLSVERTLDLQGCRKLTSLPKMLNVGRNLHLTACSGLTRLPEGLRFKEDLLIVGCRDLMGLPDELSAGSVTLMKSLQQKVKEDAKRLKAEGKIGDINFVEFP